MQVRITGGGRDKEQRKQKTHEAYCQEMATVHGGIPDPVSRCRLCERVLAAGRSQREVETIAAFLALEMVMPKNIDDIPAQRILEFRAKHLSERGAFQKYLSDFLDKRQWLGNIDDPSVVETRLKQEYEKELQPRLAELREKLSGAKIDTVTGVLTLQVGTPWLVTQAAALAGVAANPIAAVAAGAALAFAKVMRDRSKAHGEALKASQVAYLLRTEKDLAPKTVLGWVTERARNMFGV